MIPEPAVSRPLYKRWWFIAIGVTVLLGVIVAIAGPKDPAPSESSLPSPGRGTAVAGSTANPSVPGTTATFSDPLNDSAVLIAERYGDCFTALGIDPATADPTPQTDGTILVFYAGPPALAFRVPLTRGNGGQVFTVPADDATIAALAQVGC